MNVYSILLLLLLGYYYFVVEAIRCAHNCPFIFLTFNITISENMCRKVEKNHAQCSLTIVLDFDNRGGGGELAAVDSKGSDSLQITTEFGFNSTNSTIQYFCSMSDNCAWEFFYELFSPELVEFDALSVHGKLKQLLYKERPHSSGISCANDQCSSQSYCQAHLDQFSSLQSNSLTINNHLQCVNASTRPDMIKIEQIFSSFQTNTTNMTLLCNHADCNKNATVLHAYELIMNEFILPVNYSISNINSSINTIFSYCFITRMLLFSTLLFVFPASTL